MGNGLMAPPEESRVFVAIGMLQSEVSNLSDKFDELNQRTTDEQRKVHDIVVATSEAIRNLTRIIDEMKPLTDDYREKRAEKRGEERYKSWLYGLVASAGGLMVFILGKLWDAFTTRPPHP